MPEKSIVALDRVCKGFDEAGHQRSVLDQLCFSCGMGDFVAVTGPSGAGKSTLLNILGGIEVADSGTVNVSGVSLADLSETGRTLFRRRYLGFVFQFFNLIPTLTVMENLRLPLALCEKSVEDEYVFDILARFDLTDRADSYPDVLSGGEQQRIAVIRASIHQPPILIADEPTGNLDLDAGQKVLDLLSEVAADGCSVIIVTHSAQAASVARQQYVLENGKLHLQ